MKKVLIFMFVCIALACCTKKKKDLPEVAVRDTTITVENSFTELFTDSLALDKFVHAHGTDDSLANRMQSFYNQRNYQFAWFFNDGLAEFVPIFMDLQNDYIHYSGDSSLYNPVLTAEIDSLKNRKVINSKDSLVVNTELMLTQQFFRYVNRAYSGDQRINARELSWFIPRKKIDAGAFLDSLLKNKGQNVAAYEPVNRQYNLLKEKLTGYDQIRQSGNSDTLTADRKKYKEGDKSEGIASIRRRLQLLGDISDKDTSGVVDSAFIAGVKSFQQRFGMKVDGSPGTAFFKEINVSAEERIRQILINMERIRWIPAEPSTDYLLVNIPEFKLHAYENGKPVFDMNVVVGSEAHSTVIFSGKLNQVVFSPYWNVTPNIIKNEILPAIRRNPNYLAKHNMEWNNNTIRQKPGPRNSLGLVKFLFPNSYNIYLHDTPSKSLFGESQRAFSHGCIRLSEPKRLAEFLLRRDSTWTEDRITKAMNAGKERYVRLRGASEMPVFIGYFTTWVDRSGKINFRKDVYGHDQKMSERLFSGVATH